MKRRPPRQRLVGMILPLLMLPAVATVSRLTSLPLRETLGSRSPNLTPAEQGLATPVA